MTQPTTTLARIKAAEPCRSTWRRGLRKAGGLHKYGADTPITVRQIVEAMGLDAALWCLRTMPEHERRWRLLAVRYARRVQHLMTDPRSLDALDVAERYANGMATDQELSAAAAEAWAAESQSLPKSWAEAAAAWSAARTTAEAAAVEPSRMAGWVAVAAAGALSAAEREWQAAELIRICEEDFE